MDFVRFIEVMQGVYADAGATLELNAPATEQQIAAAEHELGFAIDPALKAAWRVANGAPSWTPLFARPDFYTGFDFLSIEEALRQRRNMRERAPRYAGYDEEQPRDARLREGWFQDGWLPFAGFSAPVMMLISDASPAASGRSGQVIAFVHDPDQMTFVSQDFPNLLAVSATQIAAEPQEYIEED